MDLTFIHQRTPQRPHKKSRKGCRICKERKIKVNLYQTRIWFLTNDLSAMKFAPSVVNVLKDFQIQRTNAHSIPIHPTQTNRVPISHQVHQHTPQTPQTQKEAPLPYPWKRPYSSTSKPSPPLKCRHSPPKPAPTSGPQKSP